MQPSITIEDVMADDAERLSTPHDTLHYEFSITPQSCSTNSGMSNHLEKVYQVLEKLVKMAMLDEGTPMVHPSIGMLINAGTLIQQAKMTLDGPRRVMVEPGPPKLMDVRGGRA